MVKIMMAKMEDVWRAMCNPDPGTRDVFQEQICPKLTPRDGLNLL